MWCLDKFSYLIWRYRLKLNQLTSQIRVVVWSQSCLLPYSFMVIRKWKYSKYRNILISNKLPTKTVYDIGCCSFHFWCPSKKMVLIIKIESLIEKSLYDKIYWLLSIKLMDRLHRSSYLFELFANSYSSAGRWPTTCQTRIFQSGEVTESACFSSWRASCSRTFLTPCIISWAKCAFSIVILYGIWDASNTPW